MKFLILAGLLGMATAPPIPLQQFGGSSSEQRFTFYPPQVPPLFPQIPLPPSPPLPLIPIPLPFPYDPNQALTPNDFIALITSILNQLGGLLGVRFYFHDYTDKSK
ncbi:secretory calcium-binding phosphoprotein proline-glutamine rich 1 [Oryctolagus cuniculus]|uniref:secretory calcium-binding phosphoprotein proline-glutamine rich 1 n=1 Tax=Oryctolagus cuniculus TaxID=9986 RepID=UPI00387A1CB7